MNTVGGEKKSASAMRGWLFDLKKKKGAADFFEKEKGVGVGGARQGRLYCAERKRGGGETVSPPEGKKGEKTPASSKVRESQRGGGDFRTKEKTGSARGRKGGKSKGRGGATPTIEREVAVLEGLPLSEK